MPRFWFFRGKISSCGGLTGRIKFDTLQTMRKEVIRTEEAKQAIAQMTAEELDEFLRLSLLLHENGRLEHPFAEKVGGEENLFAMRIRKGGNFREFYAYDDGVFVWLLNGYEKKSASIPRDELKRAKKLKRKYGL